MDMGSRANVLQLVSDTPVTWWLGPGVSPAGSCLPSSCGPPPRLRGSGVGLSNGGSSLRDAPCFEIYFLVSIKVLRWLMLGASAAWTDVGLSLPGS